MQSHWTDLCKCIRLIQFGPRYTLQLNFVVYFCRAKQVQHFWCCEISGANFPLATSFGWENNPRCSDVFVQDGSFVNQQLSNRRVDGFHLPNVLCPIFSISTSVKARPLLFSIVFHQIGRFTMSDHY